MARRALLLLALVCGFAAPVALAGGGGDTPADQKAAVDAKLGSLHSKIAANQAKAAHLSSQIGSLTSQIHTLERQVGSVSARLSSLQADLALHQRRLDKLNALYQLQTSRFRLLRKEYRLAVRRLDLRLVAIYKEGQPNAVDVLLAARSLSEVIDQLDYLGVIAAQDKHVAEQVKTAKLQVAAQRKRTKTIRHGVQQEAAVIHARVVQQAILRGELLSSRSHLASARSSKSHALVITRKQVQDEIQESQALAAASAQLAARLRADGPGNTTGSSGEPAAPSGTGFQWPVSGPITSPFGERWGTLHPGIDIGVPTGTPIHAAGPGTVVWCGWMSGYGNLVMIDHHNGLATLYGHQSRIAASCGEQVQTGDVIGYVGCTGFCTGPHLHFEVRLNGTPVDPLGYLP